MRYLIFIAALLAAGCTQSAKPAEPVASSPNYPPNYAVEDGGEYGYQGKISQKAVDSGIAQIPLIMIRYIGEKDGTYTVAQYEGAVKEVSSCKRPCEFIKTVTYVDGEVYSKEIMPADRTILQAALADAINGYLNVYVKPQSHSQD